MSSSWLSSAAASSRGTPALSPGAAAFAPPQAGFRLDGGQAGAAPAAAAAASGKWREVEISIDDAFDRFFPASDAAAAQQQVAPPHVKQHDINTRRS